MIALNIYTLNLILLCYLRIPTYTVFNPNFYLEDFVKIVKHLEANTDGLVIDQLNNPGGNILYLYALAAVLTDKNLEPPKHMETLTQEDIYGSIQTVDLLNYIDSDFLAKMFLGKRISGYNVNFDLVKNLKDYHSFRIAEWNNGKTMTSGNYLFGIKDIKPDSDAKYSKPIAILVNSLDFSGGDFFPAIMQDNKRAKIIGVRTAGAGGYVRSLRYPNLYGLAYISYTASIAERLNKSPIENLGVVPDVQLPFTENDLQYNYVDYVKSVNNEIDGMTK